MFTYPREVWDRGVEMDGSLPIGDGVGDVTESGGGGREFGDVSAGTYARVLVYRQLVRLADARSPGYDPRERRSRHVLTT